MRYRVYRLRRRNLLISALLAAVLLSCVNGARVAAVNARQKSLPIYSVETSEKKVSLGFNCAWDNADIPGLIRILADYSVKATFFVSGNWCSKYPESVKMLYDAGHEIGSHSNTHTDMTTLNREQILEEILSCNDKIKGITGRETKLFRMPSGSYNDLVIDTIKSTGMIPVQWDCDSIDYKDPSPEVMRQRIMKKLRRGSILLFHSGAKNTPLALPEILSDIKAGGYEAVVVSELIYPEPYRIDFEGRQHKLS